MKRYNVVYYVLFLAVTMGAFASMAQNSYGMKLMGLVCLGFCLTFLYELFFSVPKLQDLSLKSKRWFSLELVALNFLALLFFFRSFLIEIPGGREWILFTLVALFGITLFNAWVHVWRSRVIHKMLSLGVLFYYGALLFFIITFFAGVVRQEIAKILGPIGFIFLFGFFMTVLIFRNRIFEGEEMSILQYVRMMKNKSGILLIGFGLMFLFFGLNQAGILPSLYSGEKPSGYLNLIRQAESGEEKIQGKKRYELFDEQYQKFIRKLNHE